MHELYELEKNTWKAAKRDFSRVWSKNGVYGVDFLIFIQIQLKSATFDMLLIYRHASMNV